VGDGGRCAGQNRRGEAHVSCRSPPPPRVARVTGSIFSDGVFFTHDGRVPQKAVLKAAKPMPEVVDAMRKERLKTGAGTSSAPRLGASPRTPSASAGSLLASSRSSLSKALSSDDTTSAIASTYRGGT
jgi:hypothetical protein